MARNGKLTAAQRRAIAALLTSRTVEQAAKQARVGLRTLHRWIAEDEPFALALRDAENAVVEETTRQLIALQSAAVDGIRGLIDDGQVSPAVRLRAAQTVLEYSLRLRESRDFEDRLLELESQIAGQSSRT